MTDFAPQDVTAQARKIAQDYATDRASEGGEAFGSITPRVPVAKRLDSPRQKEEGRRQEASYILHPSAPSSVLRDPKLKVRGVDELVFGTEAIDLSAVEQIVDVGQLRTIGAAIAYVQQHYLDGKRTVAESVEFVMADIAANGLDVLTPYAQGDLMAFRSHELAAVINRLRSLEVR